MRWKYLFILMIVASQHLSAQFYLYGPMSFPAGSSPRSITCADFNQDGKTDIAIAHDLPTNNVRILTGVGTGSFVSTGTITVGDLPAEIASGDMNSDGKIDLITTNGDSDHVAVALGNGNGTFQSYVKYPVTYNPVGICIADLNLDGNLDVATANYNNGSNTGIAVLLGSSSGALGPATFLGLGYGSIGLTSADFNNDGKPDLAVVQDGPGKVLVLHGNGSGGFNLSGTLQTAWYPMSVATADFNEDGNMDIATANYYGNNVSVLLSNGNGSFQPARNFTSTKSSSTLVTADFNNDGHADIAANKNDGNDSLVILLGLGNGNFCKRLGYPIPTFAQTLATGDFNNDGRTDLAMPTWGLSQLQVFLSKFYPLDISGDSIICIGQSTSLSTTDHNSGYYWTGPAPDTARVATGLTAVVNQGGVYTLHTNKTCADTINFNVHLDTLKASFTATPTLGVAPTTVNFASTSQALWAPIVSYDWNFGGGLTQNGSSPTATMSYPTSGDHLVTLVITDSKDCKDSTTREVKIVNVIVPNVFTPNGDNINDEFYVKSEGLANIECTIFDRWGKKIHEWNGPSGGWNGRTDSGANCNDGTYYYIVKYTDSAAREGTRTGFIQLQR